MSFFKRLFKRDSDYPKELVPVFERMKRDMDGRKLADEALSYRELGNFKKAYALLNLSLEKYNYTPSMVLIATTFIIEKKINEAKKWIISCLNKLEEIDPIRIELMANLGVIYLRETKELEKALHIYKNALALVPQNDDYEYKRLKSNIHRDIAWVYYYLNDYEDSYNYCMARLSIVPDCELTLKLKQHLKKCLNQEISSHNNLNKVLYKSEKFAGIIKKRDDGKYVIELNKNSDIITILMSMFVIFADNLLPEHKKIFRNWANISTQYLSNSDKEYFALSMMQYLKNFKNSERIAKFSPDIVKAIMMIPDDFHTKLKKPLSQDMINIFESTLPIKRN